MSERKVDQILLEACVDSLSQSLKAEVQGAHQIELCDRLDLDGTTPSLELVQKVLDKVNIHVKVMIRPRGGDFVYTDSEKDQMIESIKVFKSMGVKEVVLGLLDSENEIEIAQTQLLVETAFPMKVTFHKAIDLLEDPVQGVRDLLNTGVAAILTSGGAISAKQGCKVIIEMIEAAGNRLDIISAGGITQDNFSANHERIGGQYYHGKLIVGNLGK